MVALYIQQARTDAQSKYAIQTVDFPTRLTDTEQCLVEHKECLLTDVVLKGKKLPLEYMYCEILSNSTL
mgnify:CR=1 FL=1